jgi:kinetochore protein NDC80
MAKQFEGSNSKYLDELKILEVEHVRLWAEIEETEKSTPDIARLDNFFKTMEEDRVKFEGYDEKMRQKRERYEARIRFL